MSIPSHDPLAHQPAVEEHLRDALLRGDRAAAAALLKNGRAADLVRWKNAFLNDLTNRYLAGALPFCQLTAAAYAAAPLFDHALPPVACCGAVSGNTSAAGRDYTLMLLSMWGVPTLDAGVDVPPEAFLSAITGHHLQYAVCVLFKPEEADCVRRLHALAAERGVRKSFRLVACGAGYPEDEALRGLPADFFARHSATAAQWVMNEWTK